jgi:hypothetical protein
VKALSWHLCRQIIIIIIIINIIIIIIIIIISGLKEGWNEQ